MLEIQKKHKKVEYLNEIKDILLIVALAIGAIIALFVHFKLAPVIKVGVNSQRIDSEACLMQIEIENVSKVRVAIKKNGETKGESNILLQYFQHERSHLSGLTEFLPFTKEWFEKKGYLAPWKEPEIIFETTNWIIPVK